MSEWVVKIRSVGGSRVVTLPADFIEEMNWEIGDELILTIASNNSVVLTKDVYQGTGTQVSNRKSGTPIQES